MVLAPLPLGVQTAVSLAARLMVESSYVVALAGSGLSVESGIPTFRGPNGIWSKLGAPSTRGYSDFIEDPAAWWRQQTDPAADPERTRFRDAIDRARPNPGHYALAELEALGVLKLTITQNVDDLHRKAGSKLVAEIHGNRTKLRCILCESRWGRDQFRIDSYPPYCPECGGLVKYDTVMFGEPVPPRVLEGCYDAADRCDCMLAVGTSASVFPAANLPNRVLTRGGHVVEANPGETPLSSRAKVILKGPTGVTLPSLVRRVKELMGVS